MQMETKKAGIVILISGKTDFETKDIMKHKERHFLVIKGLITRRGYDTH